VCGYTQRVNDELLTEEDLFVDLLEGVQAFHAWFSRFPEPMPGSELDVKRSEAHGVALASPVYGAFYMAADHLNAFRRLNQDVRNSERPHGAGFTVLRSANENLWRIIWLLAPNDHDQRMRNLARVCVEEVDQQRKRLTTRRSYIAERRFPFLEEVDQDSVAREEMVREADILLQQCKDYCDGIKDELRIPTGRLPPKLTIHEIISEVETALNAPDWKSETPISIPRHIFLWMYSDQSAIAHGRVQGIFDRVHVSEQPDEAGFLKLECDLSALRQDLDATVFLAQTATQLYRHRAGLPLRGDETDEPDSGGTASAATS
jgi:hypothetical protein